MPIRTCSVCQEQFPRRYRYIDHISNMGKCGTNVSSVIQLLEMKEYKALEGMYGIASKATEQFAGVYPLLLHAHEHIALLSTQQQYADLQVVHNELLEKSKQTRSEIKQKYADRLQADAAVFAEDILELDAEVRACSGYIYRTSDQYKDIGLPEMLAWAQSHIPHINIESFMAKCEADTFMPKTTFQWCLDSLYGNISTSPPIVVVTHESKRRFATVDARGNITYRTRSFIADLVQLTSQKLMVCFESIFNKILRDYAIAMAQHNSMGNVILIDMKQFHELAKMEYNGEDGSVEIITYYSKYREYNTLFECMKKMYLSDTSTAFEETIISSFDMYVKNYLARIRLQDENIRVKYTKIYKQYIFELDY